MVELRVIRKREIQRQYQNKMPDTLSSGKRQAEAESQYIPGSRMKPNQTKQEGWNRIKEGGEGVRP